MSRRTTATRFVALLSLALATPVVAQQRNDEEYTKQIKQFLRDPRITTELVDHLPASATVPTPLKHFGHIMGAWGILDKAESMHAYYAALAKAAPARARLFNLGKTEEGRDMVALAIASEETIRNLERYRGDIDALTDARKTTEAQARTIMKRAKPIYYITSGMHSPETGGPQMLMEMAYRLIVSEQPLIQNIRNNVITVITPVLEVDGREKVVDAYNYSKANPGVNRGQLMMYWGKYVQHDNNRDGMGQFLALTRNLQKFTLQWKPTILHDLHEAATLLYSSTGTGPYNEGIDAITVNEWWILAQTDVIELTKRGVPGVWTYGFYDGWTPNYAFFMAHMHNATGRFYEVQSYGPDTTTIGGGQSREWYRPNPTPRNVAWGPRNNVNIQQSALLFSLDRTARDREFFLENYWLKNKRAVAKGTDGPVHGWVIPATQRRKADAAQLVNDLMAQGVEFHTATNAFKVGNVDVQAGDWIIRGDQPYRTVTDIYMSVQRFAPQNPSPYDDTGWTLQYTRNVVVSELRDASALTQPMKAVAGKAVAPGGITGSGNTVVVEHTGDNNLVTFRYRLKDVKMSAAEEDFEAGGKRFRAGAIVIPNANTAQLDPLLKELGLSAWAMASAPNVPTHDLDIPRILYLHSWSRTQDEGWVRAALETYGVPFTYMADKELAGMADIKSQYDVVIYPHIGGTAQSAVDGVPMSGTQPIPYRKTPQTPSFGTPDSTSDIRGGMGYQGLLNLYKFVEQGGTLITEGSTSTIFPEYNLTRGVTVETPQGLFARGSIIRGMVSDPRSPLAYGIGENQLPVYFNQGPVLNAGGAPNFAGFGGRGSSVSQNTSPMANPPAVSAFPSLGGAGMPETAPAGGRGRGGAPGAAEGAGRGGRGGGQAGGDATQNTAPRVVLRFPTDTTQMLLSGVLVGGGSLAGRAQLIDSPIGNGHVVSFGIRPFWRWQTHGTYIFGFNAIMNWNDLGAGRGPARPNPVVP
ncbi:MAG TPA: M14 family zinc carboxypeptidase [Gemmatimonadaceae bacterium]|nr:M14 family zinc carboxypeptidase [Gemmatimonadaceae bacterium]